MNPHRPARFGVVAVICQIEKFLVIRRSQTVSAPGAYCFPGGGIEAGESEQEALIRELNEELSIRGAQPKKRLWHSVTPRKVDLAWWLTDMPPDTELIANPDEVAEVHWWTVGQMRACGNLLKSNEDFLACLEAGDFSLDRSGGN